jgi:hypothetical protein
MKDLNLKKNKNLFSIPLKFKIRNGRRPKKKYDTMCFEFTNHFISQHTSSQILSTL